MKRIIIPYTEKNKENIIKIIKTIGSLNNMDMLLVVKISEKVTEEKKDVYFDVETKHIPDIEFSLLNRNVTFRIEDINY